MYLYETLQGDRMQSVAREDRPTGPSFSNDTLRYAVRMEIWCSSFEDDGADFIEFRLYGAKNNMVAMARVLGADQQCSCLHECEEGAGGIGAKHDVDPLLKIILTPEQYTAHMECKEVQKNANWEADINELPVETWRRKVTQKGNS